jgi:hypothetical protein
VLFIAPGGGALCGSAHASDTLPSDFCYQVDIDITNSSGGALTNQAYRVPFNASGLIANGQLDSRAWDIRPIQGSLSNEVDVLAQEITSTTAPFWVHLPSLANNQTKTVRFYIGSPEQKRNQGILFTGADDMDASDDVLMDISNNLTLDVELELLDATPQDAILAGHYNTSGNDGYRLRLDNDLGVLKVVAQVDSDTCLLTWDSSWTNVNQLFTMRFVAAAGNDLFIDRNGVNVASCDTDLASITAPAAAPDFQSGDSLSAGIIRDIRLVNNSVIVAHWGFDALSIVEDTWANPTATGTIQDYGPNNFDMTYTFSRSQTGITGVVGSVQLTSAADEISLGTTTTDVLGSPFGADITAAISETTAGLFYTYFADPIASVVSGPREMGYAIGMSGLGMILAWFVFMKTRFTPMALFVGGVPPAIGMINGWIPAWWMLLWAILIVASWLSIRHQEQA